MELYQIWIRKREAACSHTETIYLKAHDVDDAMWKADRLFNEHYQVKGAFAPENWSDEEPCGCGGMITDRAR